MNDGFDSVRISLRLANGDFFPIFRHGNPGKRLLSVVPATADQDRAEIHFYHHVKNGAEPGKLGTLRFPNLPREDNLELNLVAGIERAGLLSVTLTHVDSHRSESAEFAIPEETSSLTDADSVGTRHRGPGRWIFGALFVLMTLGLIFLATYAFAEWGLREPEPAPVSLVEPKSALEIT